MKAVLISIKPDWVEKILNGEKTVEIRKTMPKLKAPFKVYIYCSKIRTAKDNFIYIKEPIGNGIYNMNPIIDGKVVAEFTCDYFEKIMNIYYLEEELEAILQGSCVSNSEFYSYIADRPCCYGWHISDLKIYDEPKIITEFNIKKAPQSWQYVEEL